MTFLYRRSSTKKCRRTHKNEIEALIRFRGVHLHLYFLEAFMYKKNIGVHVKSEMEAHIRFRSVYLYPYFFEAFIYNEIQANK